MKKFILTLIVILIALMIIFPVNGYDYEDGISERVLRHAYYGFCDVQLGVGEINETMSYHTVVYNHIAGSDAIFGYMVARSIGYGTVVYVGWSPLLDNVIIVNYGNKYLIVDSPHPLVDCGQIVFSGDLLGYTEGYVYIK